MKTILLTLVMTLTGIAHAELSKRELEAKGEEIKTKAKEMKGSQLDDLIRGEQAAVKSYDQVLADLRDPEERKKLEAIRQNHKENVVTLKRYAPPEYRDEAGGA